VVDAVLETGAAAERWPKDQGYLNQTVHSIEINKEDARQRPQAWTANRQHAACSPAVRLVIGGHERLTVQSESIS